jgi:hypothetical protein
MKLKNAKKWFRIASNITPSSKEAFLGEAISALKLGLHHECITIISKSPG